MNQYIKILIIAHALASASVQAAEQQVQDLPLDDHMVYSVQVSPARIGRSVDNEVVIGDNTVSRLHGILERVGDGSFLFQNKSEVSGTLVNGQAIEKCKLSDGDVLSLGDTKLRFAKVPS